MAGVNNDKWSSLVHPQYWNHLAMGASGYEMRVNKQCNDFGLDAFQLLIREPTTSNALSERDYTKHLIQQATSVRWLVALLQPLKSLFREKQYAGWDFPEPHNVSVMNSVEVALKQNRDANDKRDQSTTDPHVEESAVLANVEARDRLDTPNEDGNSEAAVEASTTSLQDQNRLNNDANDVEGFSTDDDAGEREDFKRRTADV